MQFIAEPDSLNYELGRELKEKYAGLPWFPIASHIIR